MMSRKHALLLTGFALLLLIGVGVLRLRKTTTSVLPATRPSTMQAAFDALKQASRLPVQIQMQHGIARFIEGDVPTEGKTPAERARSYVATFGALYGLTPSSSIELLTRRVTKISENEDTVVFAQRYQGLPVFGGELLVSLQNDRVYSTIGSLLHPNAPLVVTPTLNQTEAIAKATTFLQAKEVKTYADPQLEIFDSAVSASASVSSSEPHLAWRVFLETPAPHEVHLDAQSGAVLTTFSTEPEDYSLDLEDANGNEATSANACYYLTSDDDWIGDEDGLIRSYHGDRDAVGTWWNLHNTYNFFLNTFRLDSYDNDGEDVEAYVHAGGSVVRAAASYNPSCDIFQFSNGNVGYDITAHEFTHAIIAQTSNLIYQNQSGALNESFADIMGSAADGNWLVGEGRTGGGQPFRDMSNPPRFIDPDTMPPLVITTDNGGVHTNSGIQNKVAFLITDGGVHNAQRVEGIGRPKMQQLMFNVLRTLPSSAQFNDARNRAVAVADLWGRSSVHGFTSHDACMVRNAYYAAGFRGADDSVRIDADCDGVPDLIDPDRDNDGIPDSRDNCPLVANIDQTNTDGDTFGDACDNDLDADGIVNSLDNCPLVANPRQEVNPRDGSGYACGDDDHDGIVNGLDNCPAIANPDQADRDHDGIGDTCDPDRDGDGVLNERDNCPNNANADQADRDHDGIGDTCDNCPGVSNRDQRDRDRDSIGDVCDSDRDGDGIPNIEDTCPDAIFCPSAIQGEMTIGSLQIPTGSTPRIIRSQLPVPLCLNCATVPSQPPVCHGLTIQNPPVGTRFWLSDETGHLVSRFGPKADHLISHFVPEEGHTYTLNTLVTNKTPKASQKIEVSNDDTACTTSLDKIPRLDAKKENRFIAPVTPETKEEVLKTSTTTIPLSEPERTKKDVPAIIPPEKGIPETKPEGLTPIPTKKEPAPSPLPPPTTQPLEKIVPPPEAPTTSSKPPAISIRLIAPTKNLYYGSCSKDQPTVFHLIFHTESTNPLTTIGLTYQTVNKDGSFPRDARNAQLFSLGNDDYAIDLDTATFAMDDLDQINGTLHYRIELIDSTGLGATREGDLNLSWCPPTK